MSCPPNIKLSPLLHTATVHLSSPNLLHLPTPPSLKPALTRTTTHYLGTFRALNFLFFSSVITTAPLLSFPSSPFSFIKWWIWIYLFCVNSIFLLYTYTDTQVTIITWCLWRLHSCVQHGTGTWYSMVQVVLHGTSTWYCVVQVGVASRVLVKLISLTCSFVYMRSVVWRHHKIKYTSWRHR